MKFRTELNPEKYDFLIEHPSTIISAGSCFADMIGQKLSLYKFNVLSNPFGNIYNPISLFNLFTDSFKPEESLLERDGQWFSYDLHSDFTAHTYQQLVDKIGLARKQLFDFLEESQVLILTLGTAFVYKLKETEKIVANCHKVRAQNFHKTLLSQEEIIESFKIFYNYIKFKNPELKIIFTVSPVRHIKDTIPLNAVSKSVLRVACHEFSSYKDVYYFPSYELVLDDLRDYRFYKSDLIHPNEQAEMYIWDFFTGCFFDEKVKTFIGEWTGIINAMNHRPFNSHSPQYQQFLEAQILKLKSFGELNVKDEIAYFEDLKRI